MFALFTIQYNFNSAATHRTVSDKLFYFVVMDLCENCIECLCKMLVKHITFLSKKNDIWILKKNY